MDSLGRRTQIPLSCQECTRRKIKCNKKIPCQPCIGRNEPERCHRRPIKSRTIRRTTPPSQVSDLSNTLSAILQRLDNIETTLGSEQRVQVSQCEDDRDFQENGIAGAMEEAALGIKESRRRQWFSLLTENTRNTRTPDEDHRWFSSIPLSKCLETLPHHYQSHALATFYGEALNLMCSCLHRPTLASQHELFWSKYERNTVEDDMSLAILFAVLSVAAFFLPDDQARLIGFEPDKLSEMAHLWFDCSFATFFRCGGLTQPSLEACLVVLTLNYAFHLTGNTRLHITMTNLLVGMARSMNLHLLGAESEQVISREVVLKREIGRRVWWEIVQTEWYFLPYHRYTSITSNQFDTTLPELTDEGERASRTEGLHTLSFLRACCESSEVIYELYSPLKPNQNPSYQAVESASNKLGRISDAFPSGMHPAALNSANAPGPDYIWRFLGMMLAYRSYLIHRTYYSKSLRDPAYGKSHTACIDAAQTILLLADQGLPETFYRLWNTTLWLVAAGIVLSLDMVHAASARRSSPHTFERRVQLEKLVELLNNLGDKSGIGERGARLISNLCSIERDIREDSNSKSNISRKDIIELMISARSTCSRPESQHQGLLGDTSRTALRSSTDIQLQSPVHLMGQGRTSMNLETLDFDDSIFLPTAGGDLGAMLGAANGAYEGFGIFEEGG